MQQKKLELYKTLLEKKARRGLTDLFFFNKFIIENRPDRQKMLVPHVHGEWTEWHKNSKSRIKMILVPRNTFKSTFFTVGWTLQRIAKNRNIRVLIANATLANSRRFLGDIQANIRENEGFKMLYGEMYDPKLKWNEDEVVISGRGLGIREATVTAIGVGGNLVSQHYDIIVADDLVNYENSMTRYQADKVIDWWKRSLSLLEPDGEMLIIGCLTGDTKILMGDSSWKKIIDVKKGDIVCSFKNKQLVRQKVLDFIPQGTDMVYQIKTDRHTIKANERHPFLTITQKQHKFGEKWIRVKDLKVGDKVLTIARVNNETSKRNYDGRFLRSDFFYLLGYLYGDGWLIKSKNRDYGVACANSIYPDRDKKIKDLFHKWFGKEPKQTKYGYVRLDNRNACRWLEKIGFSGNAKTKRVPGWLFSMRSCYKKSFIDGIIAADGWKTRGDGYRIELVNKGLIEDLYWLSLTCGYRPTTIFTRKRVIKAPNSPKETTGTFYSLGLTFNTRQAYGLNQYTWRWERVKSITKLGKEKIYDLSIEGSQNFIANGYVVHNTRWSYSELYSYLIDTFPEDIDKYIKGAYKKDNSLYFPERFDEEKLKELKEFHGSYIFSSFYLNDPVDIDSALIKKSQIRYYGENEDHKLPKHLAIFSCADPAVSQEAHADYSVIITVGVDLLDNWYVLEVRRDRWTVGDFIENLFAVHEKWKSKTMSIEVVGLAQGLMNPIHSKEEETQTYLPLVEIKARNRIRKEQRIRSILQPRFERGKIFIQRGMENLITELIHFPKSKHDDIMDALTDVAEIGFPADKEDKQDIKIESQLLERHLKGFTQEFCDPFMGENF